MRILQRLRRAFCRHDDLPQYEAERLCLRCQNCGRETAGWTLDARFSQHSPTRRDTDLYAEYMRRTAGPVATFEMDGMRYAVNEAGSHVAVGSCVTMKKQEGR